MLLKIIRLFIAFLLATVVHWFFVSALGDSGISVNIMLIFAAAVCVCMPPEYGYPTAFMCGLFLDFFGVKLFGHSALLCSLSAWAVYQLKTRLDLQSALTQAVCVGILCLAVAVANHILLRVFVGNAAWNGTGIFLGGIAISAAVAPVIFWAVARLTGVRTKTY